LEILYIAPFSTRYLEGLADLCAVGDESGH